MAEIIRWLNVELAPTISIHGVLVDVYGEGVLITGESGIGKSEAALELIKRGHRLVSDDVVEIRKVSDETLVGSAPDITRHFIELRGIGIIDVKTLFGVEAVKNTQAIDMVINLEDWDKDKEYDRLGLEDHYTEFLGNKIVCHNIPIRPGRNLAIIYVLNFLKILCEKGTLRELPGCARAYRVRYNQAHGILEAAATTAVAMTEQQVKSLHEKLEKLTGKTIDLKTKVDPAVLGGIRLDIEGTELDGTVQNRLAALRRDIASVTL